MIAPASPVDRSTATSGRNPQQQTSASRKLSEQKRGRQCCRHPDSIGDTGWNLVEQRGQHGGVACVAAGDLDGPNLQCLLVDPEVDLVPGEPSTPSMAQPCRPCRTAPSSSGRSGWRCRHSWAADLAFRSARPPKSSRGRTRSSTSPGACAPCCKSASSWSCRSVCSVCSSPPAIALESQDESPQAICATEPIFWRNVAPGQFGPRVVFSGR